MDTENFSTGLLIAALTMGSVGVFLVGFASLETRLTVALVLVVLAVGAISLLIWRRGDYPWYFMCSWTVPFVSVLVLVANFTSPPERVQFFGTLFVAMGAINLAMWGFFGTAADE